MKPCQITSAITILIILQLRETESNCGRRLFHHEKLIAHGFESKEGDWPWHAAIFHIDITQDMAYKCGGTLLNSNSILTAAHCVFENGRLIIPDRFLIYLGKHSLLIPADGEQDFEVFRVIPHPDYRLSDLRNDIAVITLASEATFNHVIQPICLWNSNGEHVSDISGKFGTVIGWGITETAKISPILRQVSIPVVSHSTCLISNPEFFEKYLSDNTFCAGFRNGTGVCNGDSGGSLSLEENGVFFIRGIVSLTTSRKDKHLCNSDDYVLFTDIANFLPWIQKVVPQLQHSTAESTGDSTSALWTQGSDAETLPKTIRGRSTRFWDCCKSACSSNRTAPVINPVHTCSADGFKVIHMDEQSGCNDGAAFVCNNHIPWAVNDHLSYGFAGVSIKGQTEKDWCCSCYELDFYFGPLKGKKMVVQVVNSGSDLGENHFNIQIPGGGVGYYNGCKPQWGASDDGWGDRYGGVHSEQECDQLPSQIRAGCKWRFQWFKNADNPSFNFHKVDCPHELTSRTGCVRH